ncbi:MAG: hypothetical protein QM820_56510 [Minicystis sp.]
MAVMPDLRTMAVDVCVRDGVNLTLALLAALRAKSLDLMVVTHPDLDHVRGLAELLDKAAPQELWRYPLEARAREFALAWARRRKRTPLVDALEALGKFIREGSGDTFFATYGDRRWPHDAAPYTVHALAPTAYDMDLAARAWDRRLARGPAALDRWLDDVAAGRRSLGDAPNLVSLAVVIEHGPRKVLLGGDVLCGTRSPKSGWKGIERLLRKHGRLHLVQALAAIKVSHHGSCGAFETIVWGHHSTGAAAHEPVAMIAPYTPSGLPDEDALMGLRSHARAVLLTEGGTSATAKLERAGFSRAAASRVESLAQTNAPCVALQIGEPGSTRMFVSRGALAAV